MSLDLYQRETSERLSGMPLVQRPDPGAFDGFLRGTGEAAMQTFAKTARAGSLALAAPLARLDAIIETTGDVDGVRLADRYFKVHDEVFGRAVDYWTPNPQEVGVAGQMVGQLLATLPMVIAAPALTVGATGLATMEDLARKDVEPAKAIAAGGVQAAGLGLGIWLPILGQSGWQRIVVGGAGFNLAQGVVTRGASSAILEGTKAADDFKAFDGAAMTLDVLLGLAFGSIAHLSPAARAQGAEAWGRIENWAKNMDPAQVDAVMALRGAQHMNVDSAPGVPAAPKDIGAHVARVRQAVDQLATDKPVAVHDLPDGQFTPDEARMSAAGKQVERMLREAERAAKKEGIEIQETEAPPAPRGAEPPPPRGDAGRPGGAEAEVDRLALEADAFAKEYGDLKMRLGTDAEGKPIDKSVKQYLDDVRKDAAGAREDAKLFEVAAACILGAS